jgi:uncharacterized membrane protein
MNYAKGLPITGSGIVVGGIIISQSWLLLTAVLIVACAALAIRIVWRSDKTIDEV